MTRASIDFEAERALANQNLQAALAKLASQVPPKRLAAIQKLANFDDLKSRATQARDHALTHLPALIERFQTAVEAKGGQVLFADTPQQAADFAYRICRQIAEQKNNRKLRIVKAKSMVCEEIDLNQALQTFHLTETDLGEYIIQLRKEKPSHLLAPAVHLTQQQVQQTFRQYHRLDKNRKLDHSRDLLLEARKLLRADFLQADVGISGANALIAETGHCLLVTNEGNAELCFNLPQHHLVIASLEKLIAGWYEAFSLLRVLARSATGQAISAYTSFVSAHKNTTVIILDNHRSEILQSPAWQLLRCIRCGSCLNHCPVYAVAGGHAYRSTYSGPTGSILSPWLFEHSHDLPHASSLCGKCAEVCPVGIPLPALLRSLRKPAKPAPVMAAFRYLATRPRLWYAAIHIFRLLLLVPRFKSDFIRWLPFARAWHRSKNIPRPVADPYHASRSFVRSFNLKHGKPQSLQ